MIDEQGCNYYTVIMVTGSDVPRTATAIRFPKPVLEELRVAAQDRDLSVNFLVVKAVQEFLTRLIPADEFTLTRPN